MIRQCAILSDAWLWVNWLFSYGYQASVQHRRYAVAHPFSEIGLD